MRFKLSTRPIAGASNALLFLLVTFALLFVIGGAFAQKRRSEPARCSETKAKIKELKVSPKKISFGTLAPLEAGSPRTVTIHNPNSIAIDIISIDSSNLEFVHSTGCVASLPAGGECEMSVVFTPSSDGKKSAKLTIVPAEGKSLSVKMEGVGKGAPSATATPTATHGRIVSDREPRRMPHIGTAVNFVVNSEFRRGRRHRASPWPCAGATLRHQPQFNGTRLGRRRASFRQTS